MSELVLITAEEGVRPYEVTDNQVIDFPTKTSKISSNSQLVNS